jgi:hypothetical protein
VTKDERKWTEKKAGEVIGSDKIVHLCKSASLAWYETFSKRRVAMALFAPLTIRNMNGATGRVSRGRVTRRRVSRGPGE